MTKYFERQIAAAIASATGLESEDILNLLEVPKDPNMGDLALPCFKIDKMIEYKSFTNLQKK